MHIYYTQKKHHLTANAKENKLMRTVEVLAAVCKYSVSGCESG